MTDQQIIYKYTVEVGGHQYVPWPDGTRVTHSEVADGGRSVTFWCVHPLVPDEVEYAEVEIQPTGVAFPAEYVVLSTAVLQPDWALVWHLIRVVA